MLSRWRDAYSVETLHSCGMIRDLSRIFLGKIINIVSRGPTSAASQFYMQCLNYRTNGVKKEMSTFYFEIRNFFWTWEDDYTKNVSVFHDGHVFNSQIRSSDSNHQYVNQEEKVVEKSFAEWRFFDNLQSSTHMELFV